MRVTRASELNRGNITEINTRMPVDIADIRQYGDSSPTCLLFRSAEPVVLLTVVGSYLRLWLQRNGGAGVREPRRPRGAIMSGAAIRPPRMVNPYTEDELMRVSRTTRTAPSLCNPWAQGGLGPALQTLARRSAVPVHLN
jgi:hypothetical protein